MKHLPAALLAVGLLAPAARAQGPQAVRPLPGYACMNLNLTERELRDDTVQVPILSGPSPSAARVGEASGVMIAKSPPHVVNGYTEVLRFDGQPGWVAANKLAPYHSASNPNARCTPSIMSNGLPGLGR